MFVYEITAVYQSVISCSRLVQELVEVSQVPLTTVLTNTMEQTLIGPGHVVVEAAAPAHILDRVITNTATYCKNYLHYDPIHR